MRVDTASLFVPALPQAIFQAFSLPGAMVRWLPPGKMTGTMLHFDFRARGSYRMRLTYTGSAQPVGKTSTDSDEVEVRLTRIEEGRMIEQEITFQSEDPSFAGVMRMVWSFQPEGNGTLVTVRAANVPSGIRPEDHLAGMTSSLRKLKEFVLTQR